jgi:lipopolysaccharide export system permease protein
MRGILHRYIFREIVAHFILALGVFLFVMLMGRTIQVIELIVQRGVSPFDVLKVLITLIPLFLPMAIPVATLIGAVVAFSRMAGDLEMVAIKSSGISLYQLLKPVAVFSIVATLLCLFLTFHVAPRGAQAFKRTLLEVATRSVKGLFKEGVFHELTKGFILYASRVDAERGMMEGIFVHERYAVKFPVLIVAKRGFLPKGGDSSGPMTLVLEDGELIQSSPSKGILRRIRFNRYEINLDIPLSRAQRKLTKRRNRELDLPALIEAIGKGDRADKPRRSYLLEIHKRGAISLASLIFGFFALPLAMQFRPQGRSHGFIMGSLAVLLYYVLFSVGKTLAETSQLPVWACMWTPNLVFAALAAYLIHRTARERPVALILAINALIDWTQRIFRRILGGGQ